jgi:hypothetical protein
MSRIIENQKIPIDAEWAKHFLQCFLMKIKDMSFEDVRNSMMPLVACEKYQEIYPFENFPERYPENFGRGSEKKFQVEQKEKNSNKYNPAQPSLF